MQARGHCSGVMISVVYNTENRLSSNSSSRGGVMSRGEMDRLLESVPVSCSLVAFSLLSGFG